ncbi:MAG: hypothetical protein JRI94_09135 [Deltaproteobacteria bacterium]|nr:hypothetical protein [Deltaproteobacteria bacterium]MBW2033740.1 hypothetical protein [Deltaproteobacteria bacterium]MBW2114857.1 hypothetical protein [Deltaproteobacteria bacterium]
MEKKRHVNKLLSVFDLSDCGDLSLPGGALSRVMFAYDEKEDSREFTILTREIPEEIRSKITSWLEENIDVCNANWSSDSTETDIVFSGQ